MEPSGERKRQNSMKRLALLACLAGFAFSGCSADSQEPEASAGDDSPLRAVEIHGAQLLPDGRLVANLNVCNAGENTVQVSESDSEVQVTARTDGPIVGDECSDGIAVPLSSRLGDRELVDGTTGESIKVDRSQG